MPFKSIDELPDTVSDIPNKAKTIFMAAFNSAFSDTCKDEGDGKEACAMKVAWGAVKNKYEQDKDGKWTEKKSIESAQKEYTKADIKAMLQYMKENLGLIDDGMLSMMQDMMEGVEEMMSKAITSATMKIPKPVREGNRVLIPFVKVGTKAYDKNGKEFILTEAALKKDFKSWENGRVRSNHDVIETGKIEDPFYKDDFIWGWHTGLSNELMSMIDSPAFMGVSQESIPVEVDDKGNVTSVKGLGNSFIFYPTKPACDFSMGCGKITDSQIASAVPPEQPQKNCMCAFSKYLKDTFNQF